jgi:hypothetical protein
VGSFYCKKMQAGVLKKVSFLKSKCYPKSK